MSRHFGSPGAIDMENSPNLSISPVVAKESFGSLSPISKTATSPITPATNSVREQLANMSDGSDSDAIYRSTPERQIKNASCSMNSSHMSVELTINESHHRAGGKFSFF